MKQSNFAARTCFPPLLLSFLFLLIITRTMSQEKKPAIFKTTENYPAELRQLHQNVLKSILTESRRTESVSGYALELKPDGSWADIDYANQERGGWLPAAHLSRILSMAKAYHTPGSEFYQKKEFSGKIHLAMNFWLKNDFICPNWWYPEIGVPQILNPVMILMETELSPDQKEKGVKILDRSKIGMTGQNKVWQSGNVLLKSLFLRDTETIKKAAESIRSELVVSLKEGVQPDWSYYQHGPQLQWGNYGLAYVSDMIHWISVLRGTPYRFNDEKVTILRNYMLEGQQWITWKNRYDISGCGRQVFPRAQESKASSLSRNFTRMEQVDPEFADAYRKANQYETLSGNRHFWRCDIQIHRNPKYYFSVKMSSERTIGAETVNSENVRGYYMGDGAAFIYQTAKEYEDIFPFWDWTKIPGVTALQVADSISTLGAATRIRNQSGFVGGVSDGENGIAVMQYNRRGLMANKAWFLFSDKIVCLGNGITSSSGLPVTTSVNQSFLNGDVIMKTKSGERNAGNANKITDPVWILHDKVGYYFPEGGILNLIANPVQGSWKRTTLRLPDDRMTASLFITWFDHGTNPADKTYSYILVPNATRKDLISMEKKPPFRISDHPDRQEVVSSDGKMGGIVFYQAGKSDLFGGVEADKPCLVMLKKQKAGLQLSVADPTQKLKEIKIGMTGSGKAEQVIQLPQGGEAGKSVTINL